MRRRKILKILSKRLKWKINESAEKKEKDKINISRTVECWRIVDIALLKFRSRSSLWKTTKTIILITKFNLNEKSGNKKKMK